MGEEKAETKVDLGLLEEDDEFEEFPADSANKNVEEDKDESRPEVAITPGVGEEDEGNQPRRDLEDVGEEQD